MSLDDARRIMTFPLRLGTSLKETANLLALQDGVSLNYFITVAVAEKVSRIEHQKLMEHDSPVARHKHSIPLATGARRLINYH